VPEPRSGRGIIRQGPESCDRCIDIERAQWIEIVNAIDSIPCASSNTLCTSIEVDKLLLPAADGKVGIEAKRRAPDSRIIARVSVQHGREKTLRVKQCLLYAANSHEIRPPIRRIRWQPNSPIAVRRFSPASPRGSARVPTAETVLGADNTWFLMRERLSGKKNARFKEPSLPKGFRPRGGADAAPRAPLDRHRAFYTAHHFPRDLRFASEYEKSRLYKTTHPLQHRMQRLRLRACEGQR
jgi:hypothetical protein